MHDKILQLSRFLKTRDVRMDFEPYFKVNNLISVYPKSIILGQMTNLNMIFYLVVSVYRLVKIWNSPQFPDEFRNSATGSVKTIVPLFYMCKKGICVRFWQNEWKEFSNASNLTENCNKWYRSTLEIFVIVCHKSLLISSADAAVMIREGVIIEK